MKITIVTVLLILSWSELYADESKWHIQNVRLFDGDSVQENVSVLVSGGKVEAIDPYNLPQPDATTVDGTGKTLIPGLINAHVHVMSVKNLQESAEAGVLTVLDQFSGNAEKAGRLRAQRNTPGQADFHSAGGGATPPGGHGTQFGEVPTLIYPEEAEAFVHDRVAEGSDYIKIIIAYGIKTPRVRIMDETVVEVIRSAQQENKVTVVHIDFVDDAMVAFDAGANGLAHIWMSDADPIEADELNRLASRPFFIIPTLLLNERRREGYVYQPTELYTAQLKQLHEAGVTLLAGTDPPNSGVNYGTDLYAELELMVRSGLTPIEALKTGTSNVTQAFRLNDRGRIAAGKRADLLLIDGDPTSNIEDISKIEMIWQMGEKIR